VKFNFSMQMRMIMQFSITVIVISLSVVIDDRWGLALTKDILMAAMMCKGK
jgi:hypothetical protein